MELHIASFDSISEVNMVSDTKAFQINVATSCFDESVLTMNKQRTRMLFIALRKCITMSLHFAALTMDVLLQQVLRSKH